MNNPKSQRVALVTGGSRGIGRATVEALLAQEWIVYFCSLRPLAVDEALKDLESRYPSRVFARACDVGNQQQVDGLVAWVDSAAGRIDCLVNNAGLGIFATVEDLSGDDWRHLIRTNLNGAFYAIRAVAPIMKRQESGWIINVASLAGRNPFRTGAAYNASKFGLIGLSEASMLDLRPYGIRVAAILPGSVRTQFSHPSPQATDDWKLAPDDIAQTVTDLLAYPDRALPSIVEIRPSRPPSK